MVKVSVIIPAYNNEKDIIKCINSILEQSFSNFEIIVVDDCSSDKTLNVLQQHYSNHDQVKIFKNKSNRKAAFTRNFAIGQSKGKYIAVQDADDYSDRNRLKKQVEFLDNNKEFSFVGTNAYSFDEKGIWKKTSLNNQPLLKDFRTKKSPFVHASCMFRKSILTKMDGYADLKTTERGQDMDLLLRIYMSGAIAYNLDDVLYFYQETLATVKKRNFKQRYLGVKRKMDHYPWSTLSFREKIKILRTLFIGVIPSKVWYQYMKYRGRKTLK